MNFKPTSRRLWRMIWTKLLPGVYRVELAFQDSQDWNSRKDPNHLNAGRQERDSLQAGNTLVSKVLRGPERGNDVKFVAKFAIAEPSSTKKVFLRHPRLWKKGALL